MAESTAINPFPPVDHDRAVFRMWAAHHFDDRLRDPLQMLGDRYRHECVQDAWEAFKVSREHVAAENAILRKRLEEVSRLTLDNPIILEPVKP
jgi:hypothetical protein